MAMLLPRRMPLWLMLALLLALAGCQQSAAPATTAPVTTTQCGDPDATELSDIKTGGTLIVALGGPITALNPNGDAEPMIMDNLFGRLLKRNSAGQLLPDLAEGYTVSDNGLRYTFALRREVLFHDGAVLSADDVQFTFEHILAQGGPASAALAAVDSLACPDAHTVIFTLSQPDSGLPDALAGPGAYILPRHAYEGKDWAGSDAMQVPIGTGPFVFDALDALGKLTLVRNDRFFLGGSLPYLDRVVFEPMADSTAAQAALLAGQCDLLAELYPAPPPSLSGDSRLVWEDILLPGQGEAVYAVHWNKVAGHPASPAARDRSGRHELTYLWRDT